MMGLLEEVHTSLGPTLRVYSLFSLPDLSLFLSTVCMYTKNGISYLLWDDTSVVCEFVLLSLVNKMLQAGRQAGS